MANIFDQFDQPTTTLEGNVFDQFDKPTERERFDAQTEKDLKLLNNNPGEKEFMFVPGRNVNVELPKGGINRTWELVKRAFGSGKKNIELGELGSQIIFGDTSDETEARISKLQKSLQIPDPTIGILPPPKEGWVNYLATTIAEQGPNILGMMHEGIETGAATGTLAIEATALAGPAAPAVAPFVPIVAAGGFTAGSINFAFKQIAGASYLEYRDFTNKEGNKLPDDLAKLGAVMSGVIGAGLEVVPFGLLARIMPGVSTIFKKAGVKATEALKFPTTTQAMKTFLFNLASVSAAEGITESLQEVTQIGTGEILKTFAQGDYEPVDTGEMWDRIQEAGLKGAIVGGALAVPVAGARAVADVAAKPEAVVTPTEKLQRAVSEIKPKEIKPEKLSPETIAKVSKEVESIITKFDISKKDINIDIVDQPLKEETITEVEKALAPIGPSQKTRETLIKGRLSKLDTDVLNIDKQIESIEKEIVQKKLSKKPTKALENKVERILKQREKSDAERENIIRVGLANNLSVGKRSDKTIGVFQSLLNKDVLKEAPLDVSKVIEIKGEKIVKLEEQSLKAQARALAKGLREGARLAKKDIKQAIKNTKQLIRASSLPKAVKDAIIAQFVTGEADFVKNIPKLKSKIASEFERLAIKEQKARIDKALSPKTLKPTLVSGVKRGKFDAQIQEVLNDLQVLNKTSGKANPDTGQSAASELLQKRVDINSGIMDPLGNIILSFKVDPKSVTSTELKFVADSLDILLSEGRAAAKARVLERQVKAQSVADSVVDFVSEGKNFKQWKRIGFGARFRGTKNWFRNVASRLTDGWDEIVDRILSQSQARELEIGKEVQHEKAIKRRMNQRLVDAASKAFGLKEGRKLRNLLEESNRSIDHGIFITNKLDAEGNPIEERVTMSISEARKLFMEWQDPTLKDTITGENGNGFTEDTLTYLFNDFLTKQDKQFALEQLEIYKEFYPEINEIYSKVHGINLDKNEFYSPIKRRVDENEFGLDEFGRDINYRNTVKVANNASLKARKRSIQPLLQQSDIAVYIRHINAMSRFIALREKTQLLNAIFKKKDLREVIMLKYGKDFNLNIAEHLNSFVNGASMSNGVFDKLINTLNRNFAAAQLGGKAKIGFTQLVSYFAYAETIPAKAFVSGTRDFFFNMKKAINTLSQSELLKARGFSPEVEVARMGKTFDSKFLQKIQKKQDKIIDYMLIATKVGDRIPIFVGGWAVYKHTLAKTGSKVKAMQEFERVTAKTQQSTDPDQLSLVQKSNPLYRGLTMFMSAPIAQFRGEVRAFRKLSKGEIGARQFAKSILIYHFILPGLYQAISNGLIFGEWDKEDQIRAAILGTFNGIPLFGDIMNSFIREAQGKRTRDSDVFKWAKPLKEMSGDLIDVFESEGDFEEIVEALLDSAKNSGSLTGLPAHQAENIIKGLEDLEDGDLKSSTMRFLGWPDSVVRNIE